MGGIKPLTHWLGELASGNSYSCEDFILAAPGLYPHLQIFNPIASGIRISLRSVHETMTAIRSVNIRRYDPPGAILGPPATFICENLLGGGPPAVAEIRSGNIVVPSGSPFWLLRSSANQIAVYPPRGMEGGHDILEGHGILLSGTINTTLIAMWQWSESPL